jgi:L-amino acid N-acyltransferase YncA
MLILRPAKIEDLNYIMQIYNEAVQTTVATFDTEPKTLEEQRAWFEHHGPKHPVFVAEADGVISGWASLSKWSERRAYSDTAEMSLYVKEEFRGRGIGRKLLEAIVNEGERVGLHTVIARIAGENRVSIHLHESLGFEHIGVMREVGRKFGKLLDVNLMQKIYSSKTPWGKDPGGIEKTQNCE